VSIPGGAWLAAAIYGFGMLSAVRRFALQSRSETRLEKKRRVRRARRRKLILKRARGIHDRCMVAAVFARGGDAAVEAYLVDRNRGKPKGHRAIWIPDGKV
jgi:hypothetical protein